MYEKHEYSICREDENRNRLEAISYGDQIKSRHGKEVEDKWRQLYPKACKKGEKLREELLETKYIFEKI